MNKTLEIETYYERFRENYLFKKGRRDQLLEQKENFERKMTEINIDIEKKEKTAHLLRIVGEYAREQVKQQLESMVTNALQFVFREEFQFKIQYDFKRGRPEAKFLISSVYEDDLVIETEPENGHGGGIVDVISISLRIALAESFGVKGPIILDEPAKHLSEEYIPNFAIFLKQISEQFDRQFIIVTHNHSLAECGDIQYSVTKKKGVSQVTLIRSLI